MKLQGCIPQWDDDTWSDLQDWRSSSLESFAEWYAKERDQRCLALDNPIVVSVRDETGKVTKFSVDAEVVDVDYSATEIE